MKTLMFLTLAALPVCGSANAAETDPVAQFESSLRAAFEEDSAMALLPFVQLPLRVHYRHEGTISIEDELAFVARYHEVFSDRWKARFSAQIGTASRIPKNGGVGIASGAAWLRDFGSDRPHYRMVTVNVDLDEPPETQGIVFSCATDQAFYRVERLGEQYRAVTLLLGTDSSIVTAEVTESSGGTGPCFSRSWTFQVQLNGTLIEEPGCSSDQAPDRARASVVSTGYGPSPLAWCY